MASVLSLRDKGSCAESRQFTSRISNHRLELVPSAAPREQGGVEAAVPSDREHREATRAGDSAMTRAEPVGMDTAVELHDLLHLLSETEQRVTHQLSKLLASEGATVAQWRVLMLLAGAPAQPMTTLARYTLLPPASATRLIDGMVLDQLVYRTIDERDRRRVLVHLTAAGRARHRRLAECVAHRPDAILGPGDVACLQRLAEVLSELTRQRPTHA